nr:hypothetical protein Iba_chr12fCG1920 [Ipomoea batatas]
MTVPRELEESPRLSCSRCCWVIRNSCRGAIFCHENNLRMRNCLNITKPRSSHSFSLHCSRARGGCHLVSICNFHIWLSKELQ